MNKERMNRLQEYLKKIRKKSSERKKIFQQYYTTQPFDEPAEYSLVFIFIKFQSNHLSASNFHSIRKFNADLSNRESLELRFVMVGR